MKIGQDLLSIYHKHPARCMPYDDLYRLLEEQVNFKNIRKCSNDFLSIYTYSEQCTKDNAWNVATLISRGLVLNTVDKFVAATPFPKFFNFGQYQDELPTCSFVAEEKLDGSLGIMFFDGSIWRISTKGSLTSDQANWANSHIRQFGTEELIKGTTYLFEIIYPENKIVCPYDFSGLVYLAQYDENGYEARGAPFPSMAIRTPAIGHEGQGGAVGAVLDTATRLSYTDGEGFVLRWENGLRLKVKGEDYLRVHRLINDSTPLAVWNSLSAGMQPTYDGVPDSIVKTLRNYVEKILFSFQIEQNKYIKFNEETQYLSDHDLGIAIKNKSILFPWSDYKEANSVFLLRKGKLQAFNNLIWNKIRPHSNHIKED